MGRLNWLLLLLICLFISACSSLNLSWKAHTEAEADKKSLGIPKRSGHVTNSEQRLVMDVLGFYSSLMQIAAKERRSQLSLAKARFEEVPDLQRRLELVFAYLAVGNKNDNKEIRQLVSDIDSKTMLKEKQHEVYALVTLVKYSLDEMGPAGDRVKVADLQTKLSEKESEISKLHEQINALKNIEQSIHERELGTISDGNLFGGKENNTGSR